MYAAYRLLSKPKIKGLVLLVTTRERHWSSNEVRATFSDFFKDHQHQVVRSSPVVPWNDPSLTFVNAGMNQFKPILLGQKLPVHKRVVNHQKCIRVGGKHNDLAEVGHDSYHHTFFEMLGNWSFGDYFKKEACEMAWTLLTHVYCLNPDHLYVTYFGGDQRMDLKSDEESRDIWRSIGVSPDRILPFGARDNFWEMGLVGPCGPSTEIHFDRLGRKCASVRVNQGGDDMIELWNLVFIQYQRFNNGNLSVLPMNHVDTGLGLERLVAVLNGVQSNYETDLFVPLIEEITKLSGAEAYKGEFTADSSSFDTAYRILADHIRMIIVSLSDGMLPDDSYKLHRVLRRTVNLGWNTFHLRPQQQWLQRLNEVTTNVLGKAYPELAQRADKVSAILAEEEKLHLERTNQTAREWATLIARHPELDLLADSITPGMIRACKSIISLQVSVPKKDSRMLPEKLALKFYETDGLPLELIEELAAVYGFNFDRKSLEDTIDSIKLSSKKYSSELSVKMTDYNCMLSHLLPTDTDAKYNYSFHDGRYIFPPLVTLVSAIFQDGNLVQKSNGTTEVGLVFEASNFYSKSGGQESDQGWVMLGHDGKFQVHQVDNYGGRLVHWGHLEGEVSVGDEVCCEIDADRRMHCMRHHTATHLLSAAIRNVAGISSQCSSYVCQDYLELTVRTYQLLDALTVNKIENLVRQWISGRSPVIRQCQDLMEALKEPELTLVSGEFYPDSVNVISTEFLEGEIQLQSVEPCCGTHVLNTQHLNNFVITAVKSGGSRQKSFKAVCDHSADEFEILGKEKLREAKNWQLEIKQTLESKNVQRYVPLDLEIKKWFVELARHTIPFRVHNDIVTSTGASLKLLRNAFEGDVNQQLQVEMKQMVTQQHSGAIILISQIDFRKSRPLLYKAAAIAINRPSLIIARAKDTVIAFATLTDELVQKGASAQDWLLPVQRILSCGNTSPHTQNDIHAVCKYAGDERITKDKIEANMVEIKQQIIEYIQKFES